MSPTVTLPSEFMSAVQVAPEQPNSLRIISKSATFIPPSPFMSPGQHGGVHEPSSCEARGLKLQALGSVQPNGSVEIVNDLKPIGAVMGRLCTFPE